MSEDQVKLARQWAETRNPNALSEDARAARDYILATTPQPTMAEVEWDEAKHRGSGATDTNGKTWVMSENDGGYINCIGLDMSTCGAPAEDLTPNGKRYKLVEDQPVRIYQVETDDGAGWEPVDADGMCREDYMKWKPWKWYGDEGESLTLEQAIDAVRRGENRPYRIMRGDGVVLEIPAHPVTGEGEVEA